MPHKLRLFHFAVSLLLGICVLNAAESKTPARAPAAEKAAEPKLIAYYFHGTIRCEMCLNIERQARAAIEFWFSTELAQKSLLFKPANYDAEDYARLKKAYKLSEPSLVLVRRQSGKAERWKLLERTWELVADPTRFEEYVHAETAKMIE
jgi:hypothetical protein